MKAKIIGVSFAAAFVAFVIFATGVEGTASLPICAAGMGGSLAWMFIVAYANR